MNSNNNNKMKLIMIIIDANIKIVLKGSIY